ncbi:uncharacterized protein RCC_05049 [Ramularia collo-cygni]|uniref:Uncharacterized protein n=1 Tax=Ramularia collo-cygni TaxID=112498 RepID=A0A2D3VEZ9_9PEZI|nr:uncharacterized protein RCC_05049 [Ramularia collo-cygni]CZT19203.1 uncharacterized protein RCC_05049 [Ramularia collo-cygni]
MSSFHSSLADGDKIVPQETELENAAARGSMSAVFTILAIWQTLPDMLDNEGHISPAVTISALLIAISHSRPDIVSLILAASAIPRLPVMEAIRAGSINIFQTFLWHGWDINEPMERDGPSALGFAVQNRDLVVGLLELGADPNAGYQYDTALSRAVLGGTEEVIEILLSHGGNVTRGDVLHWAVERETEAHRVVALLLERGAQPNRLRFDGVEPSWSVVGVRRGLGTPLHTAVTLNKPDVVLELLNHGADQNLENTLGRTPRQMAEDLGDDRLLGLMNGEVKE